MIRVMREFFTAGALKLSYLDFGGSGRPLLALHGHYNEASAFAPLAAASRWRVELASGHVVHHDTPEQFAAEVTAFLSEPC